MFDWGPDMAVSRLVIRIVRRLPQKERLAAVSSALEKTTGLSAKLLLVQIMGPEENIGSNLVETEEWNPLATRLRSEIVAAPADVLAGERDLGKLVAWAIDGGGDGERRVPQAILDDDLAFVQLLRSLLRDQFSQTMGEIAQQRETTLPWDWLMKVLGEEELADRVLSVTGRANLADLNEPSAEALATAVRYVSGWRPRLFRGAEAETDLPDDSEAAEPAEDS
jgi:hypothetical protein